MVFGGDGGFVVALHEATGAVRVIIVVIILIVVIVVVAADDEDAVVVVFIDVIIGGGGVPEACKRIVGCWSHIIMVIIF
jgi:hypothetical protein